MTSSSLDPGLHPPLDRSAERRCDPAWIAARLADPATRVVPVWRTRNLVAEADPSGAVLLGPDALRAAGANSPILLGVAAGVAYFATEFAGGDAAPADTNADIVAAIAAPASSAFVDLKTVAAHLGAHEAALLAYARALVWWHARHRFCGICGAATEPRDAGHVRACVRPECAALHFPRTDPAVIMLVTHDDACLLANQPAWPRELYSTLAGFVEPGETLEDAVRREVMEEAGVRLGAMRYHSSQPWPYPASLMVAFTADAASRDLCVNTGELRDARWFSRDELTQAVAAGTVRLSSPASVARRLIDEWLGRPASDA